MEFLKYLFWPNPYAPPYSNPKVILLLLISIVCIAASFALRNWRKKQGSPITKKLSRSWSTATLWFGLVGLFLTICRVEGISYLSMRFWWAVWGVCFVVYLVFQWKVFRMRNYEVLPKEDAPEDPREKYLPRKK